MKKAQRMAFLLLAALALLWSTGPQSVPAVASAEISGAEIKYVALTFDDGPRANTTGRLLDGLLKRNAKATFFLIGRQIEANRDLVLRMKAEGHQVGNHTYDHLELETINTTVVAQQIGKTDAILQNLLGEGIYWVRPPFGRVSTEEKKLISQPMVSWSVDPEDWRIHNVNQVVTSVMKHVEPNDIILLHDFYATSVDAALQIVDQLQAKGYEFVTVEELFALNGIAPQNGCLYRSAKLTKMVKTGPQP